jgi:ATP-dependent helicase/nuclease subunit A
VDASAGTGKTSVLVSRVLRLLLDGAEPDKILCITFTRAAAAEMSNRIIRKLAQWAVIPDADLVHDLFLMTEMRPSSAIQTAARQLFARIVDAPAGFRIQTIHAFCQSVLRRFPLEAGLAPHFDLLDDRTSAELLAEAKQELLLEAGRDPHAALGQALAVLIEYMDERGFSGLVQAILQERGSLQQALDAHGGAALLTASMRHGLGLALNETYETILAEACRDASFDSRGLRTACDGLSMGSDTDRKRAEAIAAWLDAADRAGGWQAYLAAFLTKAGAPSGSFARTKAHKALAHVLEPEAGRLVAVCDRLRSALTARTTEAMLVVADGLFRRYVRLKEVRALLDYDDLIGITGRLVESDAAWVMYKLDGGIDHLLLDEAQDTSPAQWAIVRALAAEFFAGAGAQSINRTIFVVGDGKQSIYSFQGADPSALRAMRRHFEASLAAIERPLEPVDLTKSYRSTKPVLDLVDAVFADPAVADGVHDDPLGLAHGLHRVAAPGLVELWEPIAPEEADDPAANWTPPVADRQIKSSEVRLANRIADRIASLVAAPQPDGTRFEPGHVMILVRRRTRFVAPMVRALKARGIPVAGIDRLALTTPLAVQDLMALGRFLLLPEDDLNLAALLKSPLIGIDEDRLFTLAYNRPGSLWNALLAAAEQDAASFGQAQAWLSARLGEADFKRPHELFANVLTQSCPGDPGGSGKRALWLRLGPDCLDPIEEFLSAALDYEQRHAPTLEGFIGWLETSEAEIKRELSDRADAVRIVTVHGAKGLESPIVFLPDTMQLPSANNGPQLLWRTMGDRRIPYWAPRSEMRPILCADLSADIRAGEMREYRRLLYVALTRARDRLYVCGWHGAKKPTPGHWHQLVEAGMRLAEAERAETEHGPMLRLERMAAIDFVAGRAGEARDPVPPLPDWARMPPPAEPRPFRPLAPSRPELPGMEAPAVHSPTGRTESAFFRRGRAMHRLLQLLPELDPAEWQNAGQALLPDFAAPEREQMVAEALGVIADPALGSLFGPTARGEVPIVGRIGTRGVAGRIDRLLVEPGLVTIADYKTGRIPGEGPHAVPAAYLAQMAAYRAVLRQIYPDREIAVVLIWTDGPVAVTLDPDSLDRFETYLTSAPVNTPQPAAA